MSSKYLGIDGGGFGKSDRFKVRGKSDFTPGPDYNIKSFTSEKVQGPVYAKIEKSTMTVAEAAKMLPHPSKDRTSFMIGTIKNEMAYTSSVSSTIGPAAYKPDFSISKPREPRNKFGMNPRFQSLTKQYLSKELNTINFCTAGPGPKYLVTQSNIDLETGKAPSYSFRSKGDTVADRSSFLSKSMKEGVGPAKYNCSTAPICQQLPRPVMGKANRWANGQAAAPGLSSPGPKYNPANGELAEILQKSAVTVAGKWAPY